ncbi:protein prenylyltransferase [Nadsonia fulvescens var. elongata DSM 6958]|uniref:Geranylgeranyl transferase type-2 subunit alpha n=1 Tax=Nadsonia fulvescens var. elongata DSM 6958 TaxID=857566 RepID=A0A1E3PKH7_9ASCO|nr:protein prenylyltransferase [Nadsonia fulvescens var. elongata DSM 6958]
MIRHGVKRVRTTAEQLALKKKREAIKITEYRGLVDRVNASRAQGCYNLAALDLTTQLLTWNPEYYTIWNYRREIFTEGLFPTLPDLSSSDLATKLDSVQAVLDADLHFIEARLKQSPKCYWIWNHRKWCLGRSPQPNWAREMKLVGMILEYDERNYHGWEYRRYVVRQHEAALIKALDSQSELDAMVKIDQIKSNLLRTEFAYTTKKINKNFSNFSAWHNRAKLMPQLLSNQTSIALSRKKQDEQVTVDPRFSLVHDPLAFLRAEIEFIRQAIFTDPDDQSAWLYHRWLITSPRAICSGPAANLPGALPLLPLGSTLMTHDEEIDMVKCEIESIGELYDYEPDSKWCIYGLIFFNVYLVKTLEGQRAVDFTAEFQEDIRSKLHKLIELDPLRAGQYRDWESSIFSN